MTIKPGEPVPSVTIKQATPEGGREVDPAALFANKTVVMFSLPGAFTSTCSTKHLPGYLARYDEIKKSGVDLIACLSVNDAAVMQAWADAHRVGDKIVMLADGSALFTRALGIQNDLTAKHMGIRARRGLFTIRNGIVESIDLEEPGKFEASSAEACLRKVH